MATVHLVLVDAASGRSIGEVDLPADNLPESFAATTTLHLGDSDWTVERAEPITRAAAAAAGRLRLVVRKVERVDPRTVLFSLPTLENALPPMQDGDGDALRIHEDDWRQLELVAARFEPEVVAELAAIREVHAERDGAGFRRLHVRERIPQPLAGTELPLASVSRGPRRHLAFEGSSGIVAGGFAFDATEGALYGREEAGCAVVVAAWRAPLDVLAAVARGRQLLIVDWCHARMIRP
jgi:hypothetical protein